MFISKLIHYNCTVPKVLFVINLVILHHSVFKLLLFLFIYLLHVHLYACFIYPLFTLNHFIETNIHTLLEFFQFNSVDLIFYNINNDCTANV